MIGSWRKRRKRRRRDSEGFASANVMMMSRLPMSVAERFVASLSAAASRFPPGVNTMALRLLQARRLNVVPSFRY